jgi:hypothetical protein
VLILNKDSKVTPNFIKEWFKNNIVPKELIKVDIEEGSVTPRLPLLEWTQGRESVRIIDERTAKLLIEMYGLAKDEIYMDIIEGFKKILSEERKKTDELRELLLKEKRELEKLDEIRAELKEYKALYGNHLDPIELIKEMWKGGKRRAGRLLVGSTKWERVNRNKYRESIKHWQSMFESWGLIESIGVGEFIAEVDMVEAIKIVREKTKGKG